MTCIYLIQPAELSGTNRFKVGMSAKYIDRIKSYGADVRVLGVFECKKIREVEKELIEELNKKDNVKVIKGKEYFEGPESVIYNTFAEVANKYKKEQYDEEEVALVLDELLGKVEENVRQEQADPMGEIREKIRKEIEAEIREKVEEELREKIRKEVETEIRKKIRKEVELEEKIRKKIEAEIKEKEEENKKININALLEGSQFICKTCDYRTGIKCNFQKHITTKTHIEKVNLDTSCNKCFKKFNNKWNKERHIKNCKAGSL